MSNEGIPGSVGPWDIASRGVGSATFVGGAFGGVMEVAMGAMAAQGVPKVYREREGLDSQWSFAVLMINESLNST